jgi:hypothetical protein
MRVACSPAGASEDCTPEHPEVTAAKTNALARPRLTACAQYAVAGAVIEKTTGW